MLEKDGKIIGNIAIREIYERSEQQGGKSGILVILIGDKSYWGQGIATDAERAVLSWAFDEGGFESVLARVNPDNTASLKTLEKLKAKQVGVEPNEAGKDWLLFKFTKLSN